jgi:hypothetical protein
MVVVGLTEKAVIFSNQCVVDYTLSFGTNRGLSRLVGVLVGLVM